MSNVVLKAELLTDQTHNSIILLCNTAISLLSLSLLPTSGRGRRVVHNEYTRTQAGFFIV